LPAGAAAPLRLVVDLPLPGGGGGGSYYEEPEPTPEPSMRQAPLPPHVPPPPQQLQQQQQQHQQQPAFVLPSPLAVGDDGTGAGTAAHVNAALEPLVHEVQRLLAALLRGADFLLLGVGGGSGAEAPASSPRLRVRLQLEAHDARTVAWRLSGGGESAAHSFHVLDLGAIRVEPEGGGRRFALLLGEEGAPHASCMQLQAPDAALARDWVHGLTALHALASGAAGGGVA
jgi:hypothetical protein